MRVFAIGDLHLSEANPKPMDVFGEHWFQHWERIKNNWINRVEDEDVVLIPGDISWAMRLEEAKPDLDSIGRLPGRKILIRGNHDYWWASISKVRKLLPCNMFAIQNDSVIIDDIAFCGTRGWAVLEGREDVAHDIKVFNRELNRLKLSLDSAKDAYEIVVMLHYPPFAEMGKENDMARMIRQYPVKHVVFGHLHGASLSSAVEGEIDGITYHLVSCDYLNFDLKLIMER